MIFLLDYMPNFIRRKILAKEYEGVHLEERLQLKIFGGLTMMKELYRMYANNMVPTLKIGDSVPSSSEVYDLSSNAKTRLASLLNNTNSRPLVINFGSCT